MTETCKCGKPLKHNIRVVNRYGNILIARDYCDDCGIDTQETKP